MKLDDFYQMDSSGLMAFMTALQIKAKMDEKNLTPEQKAEREERKRIAELKWEEQVRVTKIAQSICPSCESKLIRGKKDKKLNYKRQWKCTKCEEIHYA